MIKRLLELLRKVLASRVDALLQIRVFVGENVISKGQENLADLFAKVSHLDLAVQSTGSHVRKHILHVSVLNPLRSVYND
jgi:hypothetical protein